jgi:HEAT repeat protein
MNLLIIVSITAAILTLLSILLLTFIIGMRVFTDRSINHQAEFRKRAIPLINAYLRGEATVEIIAPILLKDQHLALLILMELADSLDERERKKLHPLFVSLPKFRNESHALKSRHWQTRLHGAERLGYLGDDSSLPALMTALRDDVVGVRFAAARSLIHLGCDEAVEPILSSLDIPGEVSQRRVAEIISSLGSRAIDPILNVMNGPGYDDASLSIAARVAGILRSERAVSSLSHLLKHQVANVRLNAIRSLASIGDHSVIQDIASLGEDPSWEVRSSVMTALGKLRASENIPLLLDGLSDQEWWVRHNAGYALMAIGDQGITALRNAADHHTDAFGRDMSRQILQQKGLLEPSAEVQP